MSLWTVLVEFSSVIGNGGKQPFHERLYVRLTRLSWAGDAQLAGLHVGKDGNDLVAARSHQGGHVRVFRESPGQVFEESRGFKGSGNQNGIPALFRKTEEAFLHQVVAFQRIRREAQPYGSVPLVPQMPCRMMGGCGPVAVQIGQVAALIGSPADNAGNAVCLEPELGLLRGTVKNPADAFRFAHQLASRLSGLLPRSQGLQRCAR